MLAPLQREIIGRLVLLNVTALGCSRERRQRCKSPAREGELRGESVDGALVVQLREDGAVRSAGEDELVYCTGAEGVSFAELSGVRRLRAIGVEDRVDGIGPSCLQAVIVVVPSKQAVVLPKDLIDAQRPDPLVREVAAVLPELKRAGHSGAEQREGIGARSAAATWNRHCGTTLVAAGVVIQIDGLLIEGGGRRLRRRVQMGQSCRLKLR